MPRPRQQVPERAVGRRGRASHLGARPVSNDQDGSADGTLSGTTFIQRLNTTGGTAPASGCDAEGATAPVFYTADYYFWKAA